MIRDTPPAGVALLSFSMTVTAAVLQPGDVSLITNPVSAELNRLQVETALLASLPIPSGTYTSLTVTFANPVLTILNNSGAANGSCATGAICKLSPVLTVSSVNFTGQPFPVTGDAFVLLLDFDLSKSLSDLETINPVVTLQQLTPTELAQEPLSVKQLLGNIVSDSGDFVDGFYYGMVADVGTVDFSDGSVQFSAQYVDVPNGCFGISSNCLVGQTVEVDLRSLDEARRITLKFPPPELEGVIVAVNSGSQFDIVLLHQVPAVTGLELGDLVRINLQSGTVVEAVDVNPALAGLLFSAPSDLLVGQVVTARARSAPSGAPIAVTTDRLRLKSGALTAQVKSILNATDFIVNNLPGNFSSVQIQVHTDAQTSFLAISGVGSLKAGDTVSLSGFLLKTTGDPVLLAEGVRKR